MTRYFAKAAWLGGEALARDVALEVEDGVFTSIERGVSREGATNLKGVVVPGLVNTHSHAFHRLLRGRTNREGGDFWAWRDRMFETATGLDPDSYEQVATAVFTEMALAGITTVGEFHYLHHRIGGTRYADPNEMGHAMVRAARRAGIRIGLLDAGYFVGGFNGRRLTPVQERFTDGTVDAWMDRVDALTAHYEGADDVTVGVAPHSVRAVTKDDLERLAARKKRAQHLHIHVSEQPQENRDCEETYGVTPVALLEQVGLLGPTTTVIHGTHLTQNDIRILGSTATGVCYCATTEQDLADGIGPARALYEAGSPLSVGSDSHAVIDLFQEARYIELHARLVKGRRGIFAPSSLLSAATVNGSDALGFDRRAIAVGARADFTVLSGKSPRLAGLPYRTESVVFGASQADVTDVFVGGRQIVKGGEHPEAKAARRTFRRHW